MKLTLSIAMLAVLIVASPVKAERRTTWYYRGPKPTHGPAVVIVNVPRSYCPPRREPRTVYAPAFPTYAPVYAGGVSEGNGSVYFPYVEPVTILNPYFK